MSILDISNWTIDEINNSIDTFKDTSLTDIGMVNCDIDSINVVGEVATATLWINEDVGIDGYTGIAPLKIYKEDKVELRLSSPLLEGDTIEVVDGKLCHVHRWNTMELNGSENWEYFTISLGSTSYAQVKLENMYANNNINCVLCDKILSDKGVNYNYNKQMMYIWNWEERYRNALYLHIYNKNLSTQTVEGFKQYIQENPLTITYKLLEPTYENITPLQSEIVLKTFEECNMNIVTNLPIKANVSYRTNVPSISTLSNRVAEVSESDSVIQNLIDIIDDEVDE